MPLLPSFPLLSLLTFSLLIPIVPVEEAQPNKIAPIINQNPTLNTFIPSTYIHIHTQPLSLSLSRSVSDPPLSLYIYAISVYIIAIRPKGSYDDVSRRILRFLEPGTC